MAPISVADILTSDEFKQKQEKARKHIHHTFQDYGLYLAEKLGDPQHKSIYMRIAKNEDRAIIEQALSSVLDATEINRGPLFMWKLKEIRKHRHKDKLMKSRDHDEIMTQMSDVCNLLATAMESKYKRELDQSDSELVSTLAKLTLENHRGRGKAKLLELGCGPGVYTHRFAALGVRTYGLAIASRLAKRAKQLAPEATCIYKQSFLEHSYKQGQFNTIFVHSLWRYVPLNAELEYFNQFFFLLNQGGTLAIQIVSSDKDEEAWHTFNWGEEELLRFEKRSEETALIAKAEAAGFEANTKDSHPHVVFFTRL